MKMSDAIQNVDAVVAKARSDAMQALREHEEQFVESVTSRGAMTTEQALAVVAEQRSTVLEELDTFIERLRGFISRGGTDAH